MLFQHKHIKKVVKLMNGIKNGKANVNDWCVMADKLPFDQKISYSMLVRCSKNAELMAFFEDAEGDLEITTETHIWGRFYKVIIKDTKTNLEVSYCY